MPQFRDRLIVPYVLRRLKHMPIVAIQGARQTGKSVLARELLKNALPKLKTVSLDNATERSQAQDAPQTFLSRFENDFPIIIDEAQKAPALFDSIKYKVDLKRVPGQYILLGSTEFSHLQNIRESLTGRMGRVRLLPLIYTELHQGKNQSLNRSLFMKYLNTGGMPALCFIRDEQARSDAIQDWIDLTCTRDILQFKKIKLDSELCYNIIKQCSQLEEPTQAELSKKLKTDGRKINTHLRALCEIFVLNEISPFPLGTSKPIYIPLDAGIADYLGAPLLRRLQIVLLNERLMYHSLLSPKKPQFYYYRSRGKKLIHWIEEKINGEITAYQIFENERIKKTDLELLKAFQNKVKNKVRTVLLAPVFNYWSESKIEISPWENMLITYNQIKKTKR